MTHASESQHWYSRDGTPAYEVTAKTGGLRPTTLRDARSIGLVPSVTTILKCQDKPALTIWMIDQAIMAALTLPRRENELEADWIARIKKDAKEHAKNAADKGTEIHAAIQGHYEGIPPPDELWPHTKAAVDEVHKYCKGQVWIPEQSFAHPIGFGGKVDLSSNAGWVVDFKGKDFIAEDLDSLKTWDEHAQQLAAYRMGLGMQQARCGIEIGRAHV